jgi:glycosyltransferase involved in cell wall biosynthesis
MTDRGPTFSVVIPAYNARDLIGSTIRSVLEQTRDDFELIVVDDGSHDGTPDVVSAIDDPHLRLVRQANSGTAGARNRGVLESSGELVSFLDNDDLWMPTYLEMMGAALEADAGAGFAYTDGWSFDDRSRRIMRRSAMSGSDPPVPPPSDREEFLAELMRRNFILSSATVRRSALEEVGGFRDNLGGCDDYDLWVRILLAGHRAVRPPGLLVLQRERWDSQSKDALTMERGLAVVVEDGLATGSLPSAARANAEAQLEEIRRTIASLSDLSRGHLLARRFRAMLGAVSKRVLRRRRALSKPPPEVADAFPDLKQR